jgi:anthranilate/para-aminobenzoate synthase component II
MASSVYHRSTELFRNLPNPVSMGRYHSLIVSDVPCSFNTTALSAEKEIMAIRHNTKPIFGVQFHPESILSPEGQKIIENFLNSTTVIANNDKGMIAITSY